MPSRYAEKRAGEPASHPEGNVDLHWLSDRANRNHSTARGRRSGSDGCGRFTGNTRRDASTAWDMALISRHATHDHVSPIVLAAQPIAGRKTQSLGRHDGGAGKTRAPDQRATAKLFSLIMIFLLYRRSCQAPVYYFDV